MGTPVEKMFAWVIEDDDDVIRYVVIGTGNDAAGTAIDLTRLIDRPCHVLGPYDYSIAIKP